MAKGTELYEEAKAWLQTPRARQYALQRLRLKDLGANPEEICDDALFKIWEFMDRHPDREIENIRGYCAKIIDNVIIGILRARRVFEGAPSSGEDEDFENSSEDKLDVGRMRACVEACGYLPAPTSAVLTYLTLRAFTEREIDVNGLPKPKRGARKDDHARWWPSLHLAHQDANLFPWMNKQYAAQRQRLRRARQAAEQVLARATFIYQNGAVS